MDNLTIEHLSAYFPYGLKAEMMDYKSDYVGKKYDEIIGVHQWDKNGQYWSVLTVGGSKPNIDRIKPLLRPLSDLIKEIDHKGEKFVPIDELRKMSDVPYSESFRFEDDGFKFTTEVMHSEYGTHQWIDYDFNSNNQYEMYSRLFEWHFDVFGLIDKGLAIDINILK